MLKEKLLPLVRKKTRLVLFETKDARNSQFISHFGGIPYFEKEETWPVNPKTENPLDFIFQIVNNGGIEMPAEIKVLQFFYDWDEQPWNSNEGGWLVKTYSAISKENAVTVEKPLELPDSSFCTIQFRPGKSLPDWETIFDIDPSIAEIATQMDSEEPWLPYDSMAIEITSDYENNSWVGGYAAWKQGEATPKENGVRFELLAQIESEERAGLVWGDSGSIYLFYNPENVRDIKFCMQSY